MSKLKIFLIEDDDDHAEIVEFTLDKTDDASVLHRAKEGEEALTIIKQILKEERERPELILLDINIPKISGLDVLEEIKKHRELCDIPVVAFTTSNSARDKKEAYAKYVNSYLVKPADFDLFGEQLVTMVNYWGKFNSV